MLIANPLEGAESPRDAKGVKKRLISYLDLLRGFGESRRSATPVEARSVTRPRCGIGQTAKPQLMYAYGNNQKNRQKTRWGMYRTAGHIAPESYVRAHSPNLPSARGLQGAIAARSESFCLVAGAYKRIGNQLHRLPPTAVERRADASSMRPLPRKAI